MNLAALLDLGADENRLVAELQKLGFDSDWRLCAVADSRRGIWGTRLIVECGGGTCEKEAGGHSRDCDGPPHAEEHCHCHGHRREDSEESTPEHSCGCENRAHTHGAEASERGEHCLCGHGHGHGGHSHSHSHCREHSHGRSFADICALIEYSGLSPRIKTLSLAVFEKLAVAEAAVHGKKPEEVHFHEVGAVDSIIDIVGAAICLDDLRIDEICAGEIELGGGIANCAHGAMPVPAPATAILSQGFDCRIGGVDFEATTPTGMAFLSALAHSGSASGRVVARGIGVGQRDNPARANVLQVCLLETGSPSAAGAETSQCTTEQLCELSANIDDMTAEELAFLRSELFEAGSLDVWQESISMKNCRVGAKISALAGRENLDAVREAFFAHSTTLGVRVAEVSRTALGRETAFFESSIGRVRVKTSAAGGHKIEFGDLARAAREHNTSIMKARLKIEAEIQNSGA